MNCFSVGIEYITLALIHVYVAIAWWGAPRHYYTLDCGQSWQASATFGDQKVLNLFVDPASRHSRRVVLVTDAGIYSVDIADGSSRNLTSPALAIRDAAGRKTQTPEPCCDLSRPTRVSLNRRTEGRAGSP